MAYAPQVLSIAKGGTAHSISSAFFAFLGSVVSNVTGDGTVYTLGSTTALTEVYDLHGDFNTNGTFTAPVTGKYMLQAAAVLTGGSNIQSGDLIIVTTARSYRCVMCDTGSSQTAISGYLTVLADMSASDTCTFTVNTSDTGGKIDDLPGQASPYLIFVSGCLMVA